MLLGSCRAIVEASADACLAAVEDIELARVAGGMVRLGCARAGLTFGLHAQWVDDCYQWFLQGADGSLVALNRPGEREDAAAIAARLAAVLAAAYPLVQIKRLPLE